MKYGMWRKERSKKYQEDEWRTENWPYDAEKKCYTCPNGKLLTYRETKEKTTSAGYPIKVDVYECESCKWCRKRKYCTGSAGNRRIERNENWLRLKKKAAQTLEDEKYLELRKRRSVECETVFGQIKGNQQYRRFLLRGREKVACEWGLLALGYNIKQICRLNRAEKA